ncbi:MAG: septum formation family protein [Acidimicrobiales bacterium]
MRQRGSGVRGWRTPMVVGMLATMMVAAGCGGETTALRDKDGVIIRAGTVSTFDLAVGDCLQPAPTLGEDAAELDAVPCSEPHSHEVYAAEDYTESDVYPGADALEAFADGVCFVAFEGYVGLPFDRSPLHSSHLVPTFNSWTEGEDRTVTCLLVSPEEPLTASARGRGF